MCGPGEAHRLTNGLRRPLASCLQGLGRKVRLGGGQSRRPTVAIFPQTIQALPTLLNLCHLAREVTHCPWLPGNTSGCQGAMTPNLCPSLLLPPTP